MSPARILVAVTAVLGLVACTPPPLEPPAAASPSSSQSEPAPPPAGRVTIAIPETPSHLADPFGDDVAAQDLGALWGLPLYRLDEHGQLRSGLVARATERVSGDRLHVTLELAPGEWSDGTPVAAEDVVATIELRRTGPQADQWHVLESVTADEEDVVTLSFTGPEAPTWPTLLGTIGVLPAAVLDDEGIDAFERSTPISGGWFRLVRHDPGRLLQFDAHPDGPLGAPGLAGVDVFIVPSMETGFGLLDRGEVDLVLGHLTVGVQARAAELEGIEASSPAGGTWVGIEWRGASQVARQAVGDALDLDEFVDGLLDETAAVATSPLPGVDGPWGAGTTGDTSAAQGLVGGYPGAHAVAGLLASAVQRRAQATDGDVRLIGEDSPVFVEVARDEHDLALRVFRDPPRGSLARWSDAPEIRAADVVEDPAAMVDAFAMLHDERIIEPLVQPGVGHAWRSGVIEDLRPSAWPGLALWNVGDWQLAAGG